jgi:hypothetical protein
MESDRNEIRRALRLVRRPQWSGRLYPRLQYRVLGSGGGFVELGWFLGWDTSSGNQYTGQNACQDGVYYGTGVHPHPEIFVAWRPNNGGYHCKNIKEGVDDLFRFLRIEDADQNMSYKYYEAGTFFGSVGVNFSSGEVYTNGERHNAAEDTAAAHFTALQKYVAGLPTLYDFTTSVEISVPAQLNDPDFHWVRVSDVETKVVHD